ncbi:MAG: hypothetical protein GC159_22370 [Phycisphaera sp.]|nr:hypothetical protein [Phycisphaera sp.]
MVEPKINATPRHVPLRKKLLLLFSTLAVLFIVAEVAVRLVTHFEVNRTNPMVLGRIRLLPYTPENSSTKTTGSFDSQDNSTGYLIQDPDLGWTVGPGRSTPLYQSNAQGVRADPDIAYLAERPDKRIRIVTVGDSFTHGDEVSNDQTWQHYLEQKGPGYEVVNLGVPGYGTDQAFLRWRKRQNDFKAHIVMLGIWPENICRNLNVDRFYLSNSKSAFKPRFYLDSGGNLQLLKLPAPGAKAWDEAMTDPGSSSLLEHEYWRPRFTQQWHFWYSSRCLQTMASVLAMSRLRAMRHELYDDVNTLGNDLTVAIACQFRDEVKATGAEPIVVMLPMDVLVEQYAEDGSLPLVRKLREAGIEVIDVGPKMMKVAKDRNIDIFQLVPKKRHYSPLGNEAVADILLDYLSKKHPVQ